MSTFPVRRSPDRAICFIRSESRFMIVLGSTGCELGFGADVEGEEVPPLLPLPLVPPPPGFVDCAVHTTAIARSAIKLSAIFIFTVDLQKNDGFRRERLLRQLSSPSSSCGFRRPNTN